MAKLLLGKEVTAAMNEKLQVRVAALKEKGVTPKLAIVRCGENPSDLSYEKGATARAELIGVEVQKFVLPEDVTKEALIAQIEAINADDSIHGCLMFRPLPKHLKADQDEICNRLAAAKDVDCMTDLSNAGVFTGKKLGFAPCTPQACMEILDYYGIDCKHDDHRCDGLPKRLFGSLRAGQDAHAGIRGRKHSGNPGQDEGEPCQAQQARQNARRVL